MYRDFNRRFFYYKLVTNPQVCRRNKKFYLDYRPELTSLQSQTNREVYISELSLLAESISCTTTKARTNCEENKEFFNCVSSVSSDLSCDSQVIGENKKI